MKKKFLTLIITAIPVISFAGSAGAGLVNEPFIISNKTRVPLYYQYNAMLSGQLGGITMRNNRTAGDGMIESSQSKRISPMVAMGNAGDLWGNQINLSLSIDPNAKWFAATVTPGGYEVTQDENNEQILKLKKLNKTEAGQYSAPEGVAGNIQLTESTGAMQAPARGGVVVRGVNIRGGQGGITIRGAQAAPIQGGIVIGGRAQRNSQTDVKEEFKQLRKKFGLETTADEMQRMTPVRGRQGTPAQMYAARSQLNKLFSQGQFTDADIAQITTLIDQFQKLNPARWPQPSDYKALLVLIAGPAQSASQAQPVQRPVAAQQPTPTAWTADHQQVAALFQTAQAAAKAGNIAAVEKQISQAIELLKKIEEWRRHRFESSRT